MSILAIDKGGNRRKIAGVGLPKVLRLFTSIEDIWLSAEL